MNKALMFMNNVDLIESLKKRVWEKYKAINNCDFLGWFEGLSPIEKAAWEMKFDELQDN